ncbi:MAG: cellulase family glycosylhydrolase [Prevotella sp.]|nr:cellulase family glycosylhydrolase [Prevotella sp.]
MKTRQIFIYALLFVTALFSQSCSDSEDAVAATGLSVTKDGKAITELKFNAAEASTMIGVVTDGDWTASVPDADTAWVKISPHAGYGWNYKDSTATNSRSYIRVEVTTNDGAARQSAITLTAGSLSQVITVSQSGTEVDPNDPFESAWDMVKNMKLGYNLGNTLESNPAGDWWNPVGKTPTDYETAWGQPAVTQALIDSIHNEGFNVIRVPVTWGIHMDASNKIDEAWMNRVEEVVKMALKDDGYCIINVMHDTGASGAWLYADMDSYPAQTVKYQAIWKQIAERFKDYDQHLIFESFNEILDKNFSWTAPAAGNAAYTAINKLQQDFVDVVRSTGGNNEYRNLAVTTYAATGNNAVPLAEFRKPADKHPNHLYATIHSYDPYNFCNYNAGKDDAGNEYDYNINVFDDDCKATIDNVFSMVSSRFSELGMPFVFGEFGAIDEKKSVDERVKYASYVATKLKAYKTTGLWWMGLYNRETKVWYDQRIVDALKSGLGI